MSQIHIDIDNLDDFVYLAGVEGTRVYVDVQDAAVHQLFFITHKHGYSMLYTCNVAADTWKNRTGNIEPYAATLEG